MRGLLFVFLGLFFGPITLGLIQLPMLARVPLLALLYGYLVLELVRLFRDDPWFQP